MFPLIVYLQASSGQSTFRLILAFEFDFSILSVESRIACLADYRTARIYSQAIRQKILRTALALRKAETLVRFHNEIWRVVPLLQN